MGEREPRAVLVHLREVVQGQLPKVGRRPALLSVDGRASRPPPLWRGKLHERRDLEGSRVELDVVLERGGVALIQLPLPPHARHIAWLSLEAWSC